MEGDEILGNFGYIFGYALFTAFCVGGVIGHLGGYYQRRYEEPKDIQKLVDGWKKESRN